VGGGVVGLLERPVGKGGNTTGSTCASGCGSCSTAAEEKEIHDKAMIASEMIIVGLGKILDNWRYSN